MRIFFRCFFILDTSAPPFDLNLPLYWKQLNKDLVMNIYSDGRWGSYRHLPLDNSATVTTPHAWAKIMNPGDLSSFKWLEGNLNPDRCGSAVCSIVQLLSCFVMYYYMDVDDQNN
jgi:fatty acid synthase